MPVLEQLADGLYAVASPLSVYGLRLGSRTTLVRLPGGGLIACSPVPLSDELRSAVTALGSVQVVIAPSKVHHLHVAEWLHAFPEAKLFGAPGLARKRRDLPFHAELGDEPDRLWQSELDQAVIHGTPFMNEVVFLHRASSTLIVADIAFNIGGTEHTWTRSYLRAMGALGGFRQSRMVRFCVRDKAAVRRSIDRVLGWSFDRVVVTHGDVLERGGRPALESVFAWL